MFIGWKVIDRVWGQKQLHTSAIKLARHLVRTDTSWFQPHQSEEDDTICLERNYDKEEEKVKEIAAAGKEKSSEPDTPLFIAASTGIVEIVKEILDKYPQAIKHINKRGQNILHVATLHRTYKVYDLVVKNKEEKNRLVRGIDNNGCTILHHAADIVYYHGGTKPTPALKLQQELEWFETVKNEIPGHFTLHRNKDNMTADQLFNDRHKDQLQDAQEWVKNTSESCSTVAVLVAGVVFAAAYSAPGGFHDTDSTGKATVLVFHGDGRGRACKLVDVGGDIPVDPDIFAGVQGFWEHHPSESVTGLHVSVLLSDNDDADIHGDDTSASSFGEKMDSKFNICGSVPSNLHIRIVSVPTVLPVLHCCCEGHF
ncbi:hypothetical protein Godav_004646 [Gossypium davidsonii]|uniref:PGG domain-containing protein n=2 Tax=Gossypium TaxID=3633 RepID=A0A7J8SMM5_GOSDV|nr:hypothetical protein [Gossypium davidsonii]MBA0662738.1 hypothetical protein [Gossypium klotzschianum]